MKKSLSVAMRHGLDGSGNIVHIDGAMRGASCGLLCLSCKKPLVARKGEMNIHSFSHQAKLSDTDIRKCHESYIHFLAKMTISRMGYIYLPQGLGCYSLNNNPAPMSYRDPIICLGGGDNNVRVKVVSGEVEKYDHINAIRPDAALDCSIGDLKLELYVEVYFSHKVGQEKKSKIKERNLNCIEIDLSGIPTDELEASIVNRLLDTDHIKIINLTDEVIGANFIDGRNVMRESDAMLTYIKQCINHTSERKIYLPVQPFPVDCFTNHKGVKIYHELLPYDHQLYRCVGGDDGLLYFENDYGLRVSLSIRRESNTRSNLIRKKSHSGKSGVGFPEIDYIGEYTRPGPEKIADESWSVVSDWIVKSAIKELDLYADALEVKLRAAGVSIDDEGSVFLNCTDGTTVVSVNFFCYYGGDEISVFISRLNVNKVSWKNYDFSYEFKNDEAFSDKCRKVEILHKHIEKSLSNLRSNFPGFDCHDKLYSRINNLREIVTDLIPCRLYFIKNQKAY